jgi:deoxyribonuclease V
MTNDKYQLNAAYLPENITVEQAIALQRKLAQYVIYQDDLDCVRLVAGVDMALSKDKARARGAAVLVSFPGLKLLESHTHEEPLTVPYMPGLLSFREAPSIVGAFAQLCQQPQLIIVDGAGRAHPRRFGIACHLGLILNVPTIGCAKSLLTGRYAASELGPEAGSWVPLIDKKEVIGAVVRTRSHTEPVFISPGHRISLETSIRYILACCAGYRLPEPTRLADRLSKDLSVC